MAKLDVLWVDLTISEDLPPLPEGAEEFFRIQRCGKDQGIGREMERRHPDVICFDFDYPDPAGLRLVRQVKDVYPSWPMIMTTLGHSEELAVWAFRSRLADYLVKPVSPCELERCYRTLDDMCQARESQGHRAMSRAESAIPREAAALPRTTNKALWPAVYYVAKNFREKIQSEAVAKQCSMSPFRFSRAFKEAFGISFRDYVVRYRLREACRLMVNPNITVTDVAFAVGFNDVSYFSRMFKRHLGVSPSEKIGEENPTGTDQSVTAELQIPRELIRN